jgi:hypothetical protein
MSSRSEADASFLAFIVSDEMAGLPFDVEHYARLSGIPVPELQRDLARLRRRGSLTAELTVDWANMRQADLRALLAVNHRCAMDEIGDVLSLWIEANPGKFEGWTATADFEAADPVPQPRMAGFQ